MELNTQTIERERSPAMNNILNSYPLNEGEIKPFPDIQTLRDCTTTRPE